MSIPENRSPIPSDAATMRASERAPKEFSGVREVVAFPRGLGADMLKITFDPELPPREMQERLRDAVTHTYQERVIKVREAGGIPDHNGPKVWLKKVAVDEKNGDLTITTGNTSYYILWGIPGATPELHQRFLNELPTQKETEVPNGVVTHNTVITSDNKVMMAVRSRSVGFSAGRVSTTFEEQMEPRDRTPFRTVVRGLQEEFGIDVTEGSVTLLGLAAEKGSAYTAFCYVVNVEKTAEEVATAWESAPDRVEGTSLFAVPLDTIDAFAKDVIASEVWSRYRIAGNEIPADASLSPHPVVPWRIAKVKDYLAQQNS